MGGMGSGLEARTREHPRPRLMKPRARRRLILGALILLGVSLGIVWIVARYTSDMAVAKARLTTGSHVAETDCGSIEYAVAGQGPPVLVVHGSGGGFDQGLEIGAPLASAGFKVIAPSRFGYLRTPLPADTSPTAHANAHACLLRALAMENVAVIGVSAGAPSATDFCLRFPQRCSAVVLLVPATAIAEPGSSPARPSRSRELVIRTALRSDFMFWAGARIARTAIIETVLATPIEDFNRASPPEQERVLTVLKHIEPVSPRSSGLWNDMVVTTAPAHVNFEGIRSPTLIVTTENDGYGTLVGARAAASRIPNARLVIYPDGGHLWVGHHADLWSEVESFLRKSTSCAGDNACLDALSR